MKTKKFFFRLPGKKPIIAWVILVDGCLKIPALFFTRQEARDRIRIARQLYPNDPKATVHKAVIQSK